MPGIIKRGWEFISYKLSSPPADRQLYDDILRMKKLLCQRVIKLEKAQKNLDDRSKSVKVSLENPNGHLYPTSENHQNYPHELDHSLKMICEKLSATIVSQKKTIEANKVNLTALYAIADSINFNMSSTFDITKHFPIKEFFFNTVKTTVFASTK